MLFIGDIAGAFEDRHLLTEEDVSPGPWRNNVFRGCVADHDFHDNLAPVSVEPSAGPSLRGSHRLQLWHRCPQAWAYRYVLGLDTKPTRALAVGSLVHAALMEHYLGHDPIAAMRAAPDDLVIYFEDALKLFVAYRNHYKNDRLNVIGVEQEFVIRAGPYFHTQRFDLLIRDELGRVWIWDHKTGGRSDWEHSLQFLSAAMIGRAYFGDKFGGLTINQVSELRRFSIYPPEAMIRQVARTILTTNDQIERELAANTDPYAYHRTYACQDRFGKCPYLDLCV